MKKLLKEQNTDWSVISEKVWQNGVIVFDTNVLLNLYRYNEETNMRVFEQIRKVRESMPQVPHFDSSKYRIPTFDEIQTMTMSQNIQRLQESLKGTGTYWGVWDNCRADERTERRLNTGLLDGCGFWCKDCPEGCG